MPANANRFFQRPRILHVLEATLGGTLRYLRDIIRILPTESLDLALAYSTLRADPGLEFALQDAKEKGWQLFPLEMVRAVSPIHDSRSVRALRQILRAYSPQILHCHSSKAGALGRLASLGLSQRPRVIYSPHAIAAGIGRQYVMAERLLAPLTDRFGAVSAGEREELIKYRLASDSNIDVIYPCIDSEFYGPRDRSTARADLCLPDGEHLIIGVGRLCEQKDPMMFVRIVRLMADQMDGIRAAWLGAGELHDAVKTEVHRTGLDNVVELPGWQVDMRPWFAAADLLLSTSRYESFGYMVAEALAMERPVVATCIPGTTDIMNAELQRFLYPAGDASAAAERVLGLLRNPIQATQIGRLGRCSVADRFSTNRMARALADCYSC